MAILSVTFRYQYQAYMNRIRQRDLREFEDGARVHKRFTLVHYLYQPFGISA